MDVWKYKNTKTLGKSLNQERFYIYAHTHTHTHTHTHIYIRGSLNKFPDFFRVGTFNDSTHMKL